jgi:hypothetical protein
MIIKIYTCSYEIHKINQKWWIDLFKNLKKKLGAFLLSSNVFSWQKTNEELLYIPRQENHNSLSNTETKQQQ